MFASSIFGFWGNKIIAVENHICGAIIISIIFPHMRWDEIFNNEIIVSPTDHISHDNLWKFYFVYETSKILLHIHFLLLNRRFRLIILRLHMSCNTIFLCITTTMMAHKFSLFLFPTRAKCQKNFGFIFDKDMSVAQKCPCLKVMFICLARKEVKVSISSFSRGLFFIIIPKL